MNAEDILEKVYKLEEAAEQAKSDAETTPSETTARLQKLLREFMAQLAREGATAEPRFLAKTLSLLAMLDRKYHFDQLLGTAPKYTVLIGYLQALLIKESEHSVEGLGIVERALEGYLGGMKTAEFFQIESAVAGRLQLFGAVPFRRLRLGALRVEAALQQTALLSKLQRNAEALERATRAFTAAQTLMRALGSIVQLLVSAGVENVRVNGFALPLDWASEYFAFLAELRLEGVEEPPWTVHGTSWTLNGENVLRYLRKRLRAPSPPRRVAREWVQSFSIWNIVRLEDFSEFEKRLENAEFDDDFSLRVALTLVCSVFAVAAENRFIAMTELERSTPLHALTKDAQLQRAPRYIRSEQIHRRALEALLFGFDESCMLGEHLLGSYKKNYLMNFYVIEEEEEAAETARNSEYFAPAPSRETRPRRRAPLSTSVDRSPLTQMLKTLNSPRQPARVGGRSVREAVREASTGSKSVFSTRFADLISQMNTGLKAGVLDAASRLGGASAIPRNK